MYHQQKIYFFHTDHLGSTSYLTDTAGSVCQFVCYTPYGEAFVDEHSTSYENPFKFSGKELDDVTGLYDHGARSRNPITTVWLGVDPVFHPASSPYAYCLGNPVRLIDPNGMEEEESDNGNMKSLAISATSLITEVIKEDAQNTSPENSQVTNKVAERKKTASASENTLKKDYLNRNKLKQSSTTSAKQIKQMLKNTKNTVKKAAVAANSAAAEVAESVSNVASEASKPVSNVAKYAGRIGVAITIEQTAEIAVDVYQKGEISAYNGYQAVSTAVGATGLVGASASFCAEIYRQAGVWFAEKVTEVNAFFDKNPLYFYNSVIP